jgi:hypothetical protein
MEKSHSDVPRVYNCCFVFGLRCGVLIFAFFEAIFWLVVSTLAIYKEIRYMRETDLGNFIDYIYENEDNKDWYYFVLYWYPRDEFDEVLRSNSIN